MGLSRPADSHRQQHFSSARIDPMGRHPSTVSLPITSITRRGSEEAHYAARWCYTYMSRSWYTPPSRCAFHKAERAHERNYQRVHEEKSTHVSIPSHNGTSRLTKTGDQAVLVVSVCVCVEKNNKQHQDEIGTRHDIHDKAARDKKGGSRLGAVSSVTKRRLAAVGNGSA